METNPFGLRARGELCAFLARRVTAAQAADLLDCGGEQGARPSGAGVGGPQAGTLGCGLNVRLVKNLLLALGIRRKRPAYP
ncbi:hypothetical protein GCM10010353_71230 [Streptomyces chryseus]|nr:hypothetical protein GCM10010353_71230 [Streptomyces chryseus]